MAEKHQKILDEAAEEKVLAELAEKQQTRNRWATETPKLPAAEEAAARKIVEQLEMKWKNKAVENPLEMWKGIQREAQERFDKMQLRCRLNLKAFAQSIVTGQGTPLRPGVDYTMNGQGEVLLSPEFNEPIMWVPDLVVEDYTSIGLKQDKAVQAVAEREKRRSRGESYFNIKPRDMK